MKLTQKHLLRGTQVFEIIDDRIEVHSKIPFKKEAETLTVMLTVLNPEPVIHKSRLDFVSRVNGEALVSLSLGKPNTEEFNAFVTMLKQKALDEYNAFIGISSNVPILQAAANKNLTETGGITDNVFEEPPESMDFDEEQTPDIRQEVNTVRLGEAIQMLEKHLDSTDLQALLPALKALQADPKNESLFVEVVNAFNGLGFKQGAVLTYAPYISVLFSDDPFGTH